MANWSAFSDPLTNKIDQQLHGPSDAIGRPRLHDYLTTWQHRPPTLIIRPGRTDGRKDGRADGRSDGRTAKRTARQTDGRTAGDSATHLPHMIWMDTVDATRLHPFSHILYDFGGFRCLRKPNANTRTHVDSPGSAKFLAATLYVKTGENLNEMGALPPPTLCNL